MVTEKFACPCCGYKTFREQPNGSYDICQICFWEDAQFNLTTRTMKAEQTEFH